MAHSIEDWHACPECDERDEISIMAHKADLVFECYSCGEISEFVIGDDISVEEMDLEAVRQVAEEKLGR